MTHLYDDPATFTEDMLTGFLDANARYVVGVPGGVVRATKTRPGKVAVVVGGGSGHYPAFCGVVGPGFADGAVVGNVFTSPSAAEAASVGRAADGGGGVLLTTGNYAGDVMNFGLAVDQLQAEGVDARYVPVTDDVASAPAAEADRRRGIAGDFTVFKCASAAAEEGYSLDEVERVAYLANDRTRTLGVAFGGCTMPGAQEPLFTVPPGKMGLGLGIHGEPGISEEPMPTASELATMLVDQLLTEAPSDSGHRVAAILNGLGRTKYEELFIVWGSVSRRLRDAGLEIVEPEVGELVTSLDMAGCSLTLMWLDEELERLWRAPADTPAYRKGSLTAVAEGARRSAEEAATAAAPRRLDPDAEVDESARRCSGQVAACLRAMAEDMAAMEKELGRVDAVAGDGDHGRGMVRGTAAAEESAFAAVDAGAGPGTVLQRAGDAWAARAGGTSGVLWGAALTALGRRIGDSAPEPDQVVAGVVEAYDAVARLGGAKPGDKTMLDALEPFRDALGKAVATGADLATAWRGAAEVATEAAQRTAELRPRVGRARPLAERSVGTPDAGALSLAACLRVVGDVLAGDRTGVV